MSIVSSHKAKSKVNSHRASPLRKHYKHRPVSKVETYSPAPSDLPTPEDPKQVPATQRHLIDYGASKNISATKVIEEIEREQVEE